MVDVPTAYNGIIRQPTLHRAKVLVAPYLLQHQFKADDGAIGELRGDQQMTQKCYLVSIKPLIERTRDREAIGAPKTEKRAKESPTIPVPKTLVIHSIASPELPQSRPEVADVVEHLPLEERRPERSVQLERNIAPPGRLPIISLLWEYKDIFTFEPEEMPGIAATVREHCLNANSRHKPVVQKKRHLGPERATGANTKI